MKKLTIAGECWETNAGDGERGYIPRFFLYRLNSLIVHCRSVEQLNWQDNGFGFGFITSSGK